MDTIQLIAVKGIEKVNVDDLVATVKVANDLNIDPNFLNTVIAFETSGTWSPSIKNAAGSGATGLIQFIAPTAVRLGTTTKDLANMTYIQQLEYVKKYFSQFKKLHTLEDVYLAVFYPKAIGLANSAIIATAGEKTYEQNKGFDTSGKGYITKLDITSTIRSVYNAGKVRGVVEIPLVQDC